ncbi:MAG: putative lipoprotein YerB [Eubacteriales bacterium SKADARSKE-1]|nr:putative lipoprotein YerB [Eubacteriales bacterium SKADARSKE-1]
MKRNLSFLLCLILLASFSLTGCLGKNNSSDSQSPQNLTSPQTNAAINSLTGLSIDEEKIDFRPVCIMTNNFHKGQPMSGISDADILYECLIEGGITRIMSVFKDIKSAPTIGTVRSARPYFVNLAKGLGGIYIHLGGSYPAYALLKSGYIDSIDLISNEKYMWRDAERRKKLGLEHSAYTSGEKLSLGITDKGYKTTLDSNYSFKTDFSENSPVLSGKDAKKLTAKFSGYKSTVFDYDETNKTYLVSQFDKPQMDANKNIQNSKPNVIILRAETKSVDKTELLDINLLGTGEGYYMSNGKIIDIIWSRPNDNVSFKYATKDGNAVPLLPGQSYVCVMTKTAKVTAE